MRARQVTARIRRDFAVFARDNRVMKTTYASMGGAGPTYEIEADRFGNYTIRAGRKVVKRVTSVSQYLDKPRWGSKKLEMNAIDEAKAAIEAFRSSAG